MILETTVALILIFGLLVMFHELGHFISARLCGMRVEEFAIGFGPKLLRIFKRGDTEYTLHPFPLGGFVKIAGMEPGQEDIADGFQAQAAWKRALVIFSGPFASFILAVLVFLATGVFWGFPDETGRTMNRVVQVNPQTMAAKIGLRAGDTILAIDGKSIKSGNEMTDIIHDNPGKKMTLTVKRNGNTIKLTGAPAWNIEYQGAWWSFVNPKQGRVNEISPDSALAKAGVKSKDALYEINGEKIDSGAEMKSIIDANDGKKISIIVGGAKNKPIVITPKIDTLEFAGAKWTFPGGYVMDSKPKSGINPFDQIQSINGKKTKSGEAMIEAIQKHSDGDFKIKIKSGDKVSTLGIPEIAGKAVKKTYGQTVGMFGFMPQPVLVKTGFVDAIKTGLSQTARSIEMLLSALKPSKISENVGGPILIANQTASMVALGPYYVITMAGLLSLSLAVINLFPIPVLDGGHLAIILVEAIRRKRLTMNQMAAVQMVGLAIIIMLVIAVMSSDIYKISQGLVPQ